MYLALFGLIFLLSADLIHQSFHLLLFIQAGSEGNNLSREAQTSSPSDTSSGLSRGAPI